MWTIFRPARALICVASVLSFHGSATIAQTVNNQNFGFNLPSVPMPNGFDEVRASDGTTCRSSMSGNGAFLDLGGIGNPANGSNDGGSATIYGRIIIPLGERPRRLNCRSLYQLEIERLKHELRLAKSSGTTGDAKGGDDWQDEGWNNN